MNKPSWHDKCAALLGKQVEVVLAREGDFTHFAAWDEDPDTVPKQPSDIVCRGQFLGFSDGGDCEILVDEDGFIHHCWPMLEVRELKSQDPPAEVPDREAI